MLEPSFIIQVQRAICRNSRFHIKWTRVIFENLYIDEVYLFTFKIDRWNNKFINCLPHKVARRCKITTFVAVQIYFFFNEYLYFLKDFKFSERKVLRSKICVERIGQLFGYIFLVTSEFNTENILHVTSNNVTENFTEDIFSSVVGLQLSQKVFQLSPCVLCRWSIQWCKQHTTRKCQYQG